MSAFSTVLGKELVDNLRDKKAMTTALIVPLLGPVGLVVAFFFAREMDVKARDPHVPVVGRENAPELVAFLERNGVVVEPAPTMDIEQGIKAQRFDAVLRIPREFGEQLRAARPAHVEIISDPSRSAGMAVGARLERLIEAYGGGIGALRLTLRGVDPSVMRAISVDHTSVATPSSMAAMLLGLLPMMLILCCFAGGTYIAIDVTAGERERGTLEPLLYAPVSSTTLVLAKTAATAFFSAAAAVLGAASFLLVVPRLPFHQIGMTLFLSPLQAGKLLALVLPLALSASALQIVVGALCKTFKTAQAALSLLVLIPMAPSMIVALFPQQPSTKLMLIPTLGESLLATRILRGEDVQLSHALTLAGANLVVAVVLLAIASRLFGARLLR